MIVAQPLLLKASFRDGLKDQTTDAQLRIGESHFFGRTASAVPWMKA